MSHFSFGFFFKLDVITANCTITSFIHTIKMVIEASEHSMQAVVGIQLLGNSINQRYDSIQHNINEFELNLQF